MGAVDYSGVETARGTQGGVYFKPGTYVVRIDRIKDGKTRKGHGFFAMETTVLESNTAEMAPGQKPAFFVTNDKDPFLDNVADCMRAVMWCKARDLGTELPGGIDALNPTPADIGEAVGVENPYAGVEIGVRAFTVITRAGNPFTRHAFMRPEEARADIQLARE